MDQLKIFISSTQIDLQPERNAVQAVIEGLGHQCLRAENLDAPGISSEDACKMMAENCDIYLGIYGSRYGFVPAHLGISVTEMEFNLAQNNNPKKVFVYIKESVDADELQNSFLLRVQDFSSGYFRHEKFSSIDQLTEQIKRDVITWSTIQIRKAISKETELSALKDKLAYVYRVMERYGIPEELR